MATSIWSRKRDLVYLVFFIVHLPVMLAFDLTSYYPLSLKPEWMTTLRTWYITTHGDRFFYNPPAYFPALQFLELTLHVPLTLWAIPALLRNDPRVPLALLVFGLETSVSTLVCLAEMLSWGELSAGQRGVGGLGGMYGAYLGVGVFMTLDCYARLDRWIAGQRGLVPVSKKGV
ncbi:integral membrane protein-like protein [Dothidotthia symphoricarpi CBS 119687]|uniref:Efficient mitochondria targeting-associated protein 19 n=1 Tax=Dothidotthia symphoricarpi CBS 119687 TaxID=1392245 RepID=A0A6A5ZZC8_9PLEO|nr:integral membrane protein-like protein [Dothidotthia symphoricarpi CBS 119687]KAF2125092.1 integral membrane protein-like protein [Dothidotthia symphoricarpi CBS 119687]